MAVEVLRGRYHAAQGKLSCQLAPQSQIGAQGYLTREAPDIGLSSRVWNESDGAE